MDALPAVAKHFLPVKYDERAGSSLYNECSADCTDKGFRGLDNQILLITEEESVNPFYLIWGREETLL